MDTLRRCFVGFASLRRIVALMLAIGLVTNLATSAAPVGAADSLLDRDPEVRAQVVVKEIHIWDDRDWGAGEFRLYFGLSCYPGSLPCGGEGARVFDGQLAKFSAPSGTTAALDLVFPESDKTMHPDYRASAETGYPFYRGHTYELVFLMTELDAATNDEMGEATIRLGPETNWGMGTHRLRAARAGGNGDFTIEFEIRRAPLPDLKPVGITVHDLAAGAGQLFCTTVVNAGATNAGPFEVEFHVYGLPPVGRFTAGRLDAGDHGDLCIEAALPASGQRKLAAVVDASRWVVESDETNNRHERPYAATAPAPGSPAGTPTPTPAAGQADLVVTAIEINGRVPDGKDDCKDGKNDIAVSVKNQGTAKAGAFVVRLVADGAVVEQSVSGLDAGAEREVRFDDVRLKKGQRALTATADATGTIAEARDDNNERKVAATCKDDK